ncbi:MAG: NADH-quinone oxidoreductase subunit M [Paenibacillaceae bacterium]
MLDNLPILSMIIFSPLLGVLILMFIPKEQGRLIKIVGVAAAFLPLILAVMMYANFDHQSEDTLQYTENVEWISVPLNQDGEMLKGLSSYNLQFNYNVGADALSLVLILLTALVSAMAALASLHIKKRWKTYYILFLLLMVGMLGVFSARDLFLFFAFFEVTLVPMFFLVGIWGFKEREGAATKFLIYNGIGSALMIVAFLILVTTAGFTLSQPDPQHLDAIYTSSLDQIMTNLSDPTAYVNVGTEMQAGSGVENPFFLSETMKWFLFILLLIAFGIKLPIFPFHTWMLKVHVEAPPSVVMIHSGILLKMGAYGLIRYGVMLFPEQAKDWGIILAILGAVNIIYGAILAFRQTDFRLVLAYSSISHMGIVLFGIAAFNVIGMEGAIFQMVSHGLISALLFLIVGSLYERTGTMELSELGGLAKSLPFISGILLFAGLASLGLPGLSGFVSEFLSFIGLFDTMPVITVIGTLGIILAAVYVLRAVLRITYGPIAVQYENLKDARLVEVIPMVTLLAFIVLLGVYPSVLSDPLKHTVDQLIQNIAGRVGG